MVPSKNSYLRLTWVCFVLICFLWVVVVQRKVKIKKIIPYHNYLLVYKDYIQHACWSWWTGCELVSRVKKELWPIFLPSSLQKISASIYLSSSQLISVQVTSTKLYSSQSKQPKVILNKITPLNWNLFLIVNSQLSGNSSTSSSWIILKNKVYR